MRKVIHSNFELDLSPFKITDTVENPIFSDSFSAKYSFPIEIDITEDIDRAFGFISFHNANEALTYINVKYVHNNELSDAILEVQEVGEKLSVLISWGFEEFPNWDTKLSELPLDNFEVDDIHQHCLTVINQTWPNVNYNFPQIHTDKIDTDSDIWFYFKKIINHYQNGAMLNNYVDQSQNIIYNRNIIQPLPYLIYILQKGFELNGWQISGDFIENELVKKICIYADIDYYTTNDLEYFTLIIGNTEHQNNIPSAYWSVYNKSIQISPIAGNYVIIGTITQGWNSNADSYACIKINGLVVWENTIPQVPTSSGVNNYDIQVIITLTNQNNEITFYSEQANVDSLIRDICYLDINPISPNNSNGDPIPNIINENKVDLTKAVPDMTFGELVTNLKNWFNFNLNYQSNIISIDFIQDIITNSATIDLSHKEIKYPTRKYNKANSFLLKFKDITSELYSFLPIFHSFESIISTNYTVDDKTSTIEINGLPLPLLNRNGSNTAHAFENDTSKLYLVIYDGLTDGNNLTKSSDDLLIPQIHESFWKKWFNRRLNAVNYSWTYIVNSIELLNFTIYNKVHSYKKIHLLKSIQKTEVKPDLFEVEIETEAEV